MTTPDLSIDVITHILARLPVKSVLRFKSVCKTWYALIKTPNFIEKHHTQSTLEPNSTFSSILMTAYVHKTGKLGLWLHCSEALDKPINFDLPFLDKNGFLILGICKGLVCINLSYHASSPHLIICNPTTGQVRQISPLEMSNAGNHYAVFFGFAFHANDYKLIRIVCTSLANGELAVQAVMYTMSTNTWKEIDVKMGEFDAFVDLPFCVSHEQIPGVLLNEVFYWEAYSTSDAHVVCFDTCKEMFYEIMTPIDARANVCHLRELKEELALIIYRGSRWFDLWVLNENDRSWTRKYRIKDFPETVNPLENWYSEVRVVGCARNGELVVEDHYGENNLKLLLYDLNSKEIKALPFADIEGSVEVYLYTESLLSVNTSDEVAEAD